jgi:hypothetical protein
MPTYDLRNKETGEVVERFLKIAEKEALIKEGEWEQIHLGMAADITHTGNIVAKTSGDWRDLLGKIKKGSGRGDTIKTY